MNIANDNNYPLYSATLEGKSHDKGVEYEMIIIAKWTDRTKNAKEVSHKVFYFEPDIQYLSTHVNKEDWCKNIFENYKEYSRIAIERKVELHVKN